jgi:hypothetical protein
VVWWIAGGVVLGSLLVLGAVLAALRRRLVELDRVAALAQERAAKAQAGLPGSVAGVAATLAGVERRLVRLRAHRHR